MASEAHNNSGFPLFLPFLLGFAAPQQEEQGNNNSNNRVILVNPFTQSFVIIESGLGDLSGKEGPPPASKAAIEALPEVEAPGGGERCECVICLEEWETGKKMPCGHGFHGDCLERWLSVNGSCPVCRFSLPADDEEMKKRDEPRGGVEGGIWISFNFNFGSMGSEDSSENQSNNNSSSGSNSTPVHEAES